MKVKKNMGDLFAGVFFLVIAVVYATQIPRIKLTKISLINSAFFPKICVTGLIILSFCQIYQALKKMKLAENGKTEERKDYRCVIMTFALSLIYVMLLEPVGFLISSILYMTAQMAVLCPQGEQKPVLYVVISIAASAIIYFLFRNGLHLMLPSGILTGIL